jgi:short-subunit dehydrogenase
VGYSTSKHAIVGLSLSLRIEAAAAGVRVSVLCPGVVRTPALIDGGKYGKLLQPVPHSVQQNLFERQRPMRPDGFAEHALRAVARNQAIIVIPSWWRIVWWLYRLSPAIGLRLGAWGRRQYLDMARRALERGQEPAASAIP